ncbi:hypothetical protein [Halalkalicoccus tibetensis]|uniref:Type IV secretion system protein VirB6 n=1 Tax=Halalkalicoccus tibetensis TaxID=175632 RepID=A0ABD5V7E5_9EURY
MTDGTSLQIEIEEPEDEELLEDEDEQEDTDEISVGVSDEDENEDNGIVETEDEEEGQEGESDEESSLSAEEQEDIEDLPIDVDEEDIDSEELDEESGGAVDDGGDSTAGDTEQVGGGELGPNLSPEDNAEALAEWSIERMYVGVELLIDNVFNNMLGTPTPENDGWQGIFGQPVGETYSDLYEEVYMQMILPPVFQFMILGFIGFTLFVVPFSPLTGQRVWSVLLGMFGAAALVLFAWNVASLLHHVSDAVTMWFLPQGEDFLNGSGVTGTAELELASGPLAVLLGAYFASWNIGIGLLFIHGARQAILFFMPTVLPIILVGMYFGPKASKAAFSVLFWQYIGLLVMNWPTALLLSTAYHVGFDFGMGPAGSLTNFAATIGLFAFAVGIPLFVQTSFLGGSLAAVVMKGSVLSASAGAARKYVPTGAVGGAAKSAAKRGGGYINPVSRYSRSAENDQQQQRRRRDAANQTSSTSTRSSRRNPTATDGGYTPRSTSSTTSRYRSASSSKSIPASSTRDAGSIDARRRERYRRLRADNPS